MRKTKGFTVNLRLFAVPILLISLSSVLFGQALPKGKTAGFASTTKPQYVTNNQYEVDVKPDIDGFSDPNAVLDVKIVGNVQIGAKDIVQIIKTRKGRPFSESVLEEDKRALMQKGWFIDVKPRVEKTLVGYIVTFQFIERPILHYVKIVGNKAHTRKVLLEEANLKPGDALDPIAIHQARERIEQFYRDSGYYRAHVEVLSGDEIGDRGAVFWISEGQKQRILGVEFEGNTIASSARLKTLIQSKPGWFFWVNSEFTRKKLDEDVETLTTYYRKLGFFYAKIDRKFVETGGYTGLGQNRNWIAVKFVIEEGPRCKVRDIRFTGNRVFETEKLMEAMKLPEEEYFNQDMLEADMGRLKEVYGKIGYVFANADPDPRIDDENVDIVINLREGPRCYLNTLHVEIVGHEGADPYTKWQPILLRSSLRPGDILRTTEINASRRRLMASQLFNANPTQGQTPDFVFSYPEEAVEDEERERAALAEAASRNVRGQAPDRNSFSFQDYAPNYTLDAEYFGNENIQPHSAQPHAVQRQVVPVYQPPQYPQPQQYQLPQQNPPHCPQPNAPSNFQPPQQRNSSTYPVPSTYQPMAQPVVPMKLTWNCEKDESIVCVREEAVYRGQTFGRPRVNSTLTATTPQTTAPAPIVQPATTSGVYGSLSATSQHYTNQGYSNQSVPGIVHQPTSNLNASTYAQPIYNTQPASITNPVTTAGPYDMNSYTPNMPVGYTQTSYQDPNRYVPPTPASYLSPQTNNQYVGGAVLYNQGPVFVQHNADTVYRGATPADIAIGNSAAGFDPSAPGAMHGKLYPVDGIWRVQETRTGQLMMSVAVSSDSGLMGRFIIEEQNFDILNWPKGMRISDWRNAFRGKGQRFRIEAVPGTEVQRYSVSWETPYLFDQDYSFGVNGMYYERYYDEWYEDRVGGGISFGKLWTPDFSTILSLNAHQVHIYRPTYPVSQDLYDALGHHPMYSVGLSANYNTRDSEYMPTEGHLLSFGIEQVFGDYRFVRGNFDLRKYFTLHERPDRSGRWVLGLRSSMGITEKGTPIYERYYGGGFTNLRGFEFRGVSPRDKAAGNVIVGGCMEFYNSAELVFPITADDMIRGSVFVDTGTVERSISSWSSNYRVAVGFGLRLTIPMMGPAPIALDFAFPISKDKHDERQVFSFNVGFMR